MFRSNHMELDNIVLVGWVDQAINQSLTKNNIKLGSRLHVFGLPTPRQWTTKLDLHKFTL